MKNLVYIIAIIAVSCSPLSKEQYLKNYESFLSDIAENHRSYTDKDWEKKNEKFRMFSEVWFEKFKADFTWQERLKITGYQAKFHYYSALRQTSSMFKIMHDAMNPNEIRAIVRSYVDKGMIKELKELYKESLELGTAAEEVIKEILKELQVNIDELLKE